MKYNYLCYVIAGENKVQPELHRAYLEEQEYDTHTPPPAQKGESQFKQEEISSFTCLCKL